MTDFIRSQGLPFLAHLLRRLSDEFVRSYDEWYAEAGMVAPARTRSTLLALQLHGPLAVTELAAMLRQSHPLVITWIRQLKKLDLVTSKPDAKDGRKTVVSLTKMGRLEAERAMEMRSVGARAYETLLEETGGDLLDQLWRIEEACRKRPFVDRLRDAHRTEAANCKRPRGSAAQ